jgi:4-carboxymuconolactone decarboxylase
MPTDMSRLPALCADDMSPEQRAVAHAITQGPRGEVRGPFIPLLHNPDAANAVQQMGSFLRFNGTLPGDLREMVILMTARQWRAQYEWFAHHKIALDEGLDTAVADAIANHQQPSFSDARLASVYDFVTAMYRDHQVDDATYARTAEHLSSAELVELVVLCGHYHTIAMVLNGFNVPVPGGAQPLA